MNKKEKTTAYYVRIMNEAEILLAPFMPEETREEYKSYYYNALSGACNYFAETGKKYKLDKARAILRRITEISNKK